MPFCVQIRTAGAAAAAHRKSGSWAGAGALGLLARFCQGWPRGMGFQRDQLAAARWGSLAAEGQEAELLGLLAAAPIPGRKRSARRWAGARGEPCGGP